MNDIRRLREQIDVCRPGSDDLALPELAELREAAEQDRAIAQEVARVEQFDKAISAALSDVPLPAGLLERLQNSVKSAELVEPTAAPKPATAERADDASRSTRRWSRRSSLAIGGSLALAVLLGLTTFALWPRRRHVGPAELAPAVNQWLATLNSPGTSNSWKSASAVPASHAVPAVVLARPLRWTSFPASGEGWSGKGVAVDLAPAGGPRAVLLVITSPAHFKVAASPYTALSLTGSWRAAAWQNPSTNVLYVLVVEENRGQRLDQFLKHQPTA
jgi:hypothetical protein